MEHFIAFPSGNRLMLLCLLAWSIFITGLLRAFFFSGWIFCLKESFSSRFTIHPSKPMLTKHTCFCLTARWRQHLRGLSNVSIYVFLSDLGWDRHVIVFALSGVFPSLPPHTSNVSVPVHSGESGGKGHSLVLLQGWASNPISGGTENRLFLKLVLPGSNHITLALFPPLQSTNIKTACLLTVPKAELKPFTQEGHHHHSQ